MLEVGESTTLIAAFKDQDGAPDDPATVTLTITAPDGTITTITSPDVLLLNAAVGDWRYVLTATQAGVWTYRFQGSGGGVDAGETQTVVVAPVGGGLSLHLGPCAPWVEPSEVFDCGKCASITDEDRDDVKAARAVRAASELLFYASGQRFPGQCQTTVRPCARRTDNYVQWGWGGEWGYARRMCSCGDLNRCGCGALSEITLGGAPIRYVSQVKVDGDVLTPNDDYRVDDWRYLVRLGGDAWPCCQRDDLADTEDDTFSVTYSYGQSPPVLGEMAAQQLACDLYQGCSGGDCQVDERVVSMVRQNTSFQFISPGDVGIIQGRWKTGLRNVDLFLAQFGRRRRGYVASPDVGPRVRRAGT